MADTAMCWAASASNVVSWWQNLNISSITSSVPQNEEIFDTFRAIYTNGGGKAAYAYQWWIPEQGVRCKRFFEAQVMRACIYAGRQSFMLAMGSPCVTVQRKVLS